MHMCAGRPSAHTNKHTAEGSDSVSTRSMLPTNKNPWTCSLATAADEHAHAHAHEHARWQSDVDHTVRAQDP